MMKKISLAVMLVTLSLFTACEVIENVLVDTGINNFTVTFDLNGGTTLDVHEKKVISPATTIDALPTVPTRGTDFFGGWYTDIVGGTQFFATTMVTGDITVYARWSSSPVYVLKYDSNGGTLIGDQNVFTPYAVSLPPSPTKTGYTFDAWYTTNGGSTVFSDGTTISSDRTVYAKWNSYAYTVNFNCNGGAAVTPQTVTSPATTVAVLPVSVKSGYIFSSWVVTNGGSDTFTVATPVTANITIYAKWSTYAYTVTYDSAGGTAVSPHTVSSPDTTVVTLPAAPTRTNYAFQGWYTGVNGSGTPFIASTSVSANITIYAKWSLKCGVLYDANGSTNGSVPTDATVYLAGDTVTVAGNPGYLINNTPGACKKFDGWNTLANGTGTNYPAGTGTFLISSNITLYAKWSLYSVRDIGPSGGLIFIDKGVYSGTPSWRYMEAAPADQSSSIDWGGYMTLTGASGTALDTGSVNTAKIVAVVSLTNPAVDICANYSIINGGVSYSGWFLPSKDELNQMYVNLKQSGVGNFTSAVYWSSSEYALDTPAGKVWGQNFNDATQSWINKFSTASVRATRAF